MVFLRLGNVCLWIGNRIDVRFNLPSPTHFSIESNKSPHYETVGDSIMDLVGKANKLPNHTLLRHNVTMVARYALIREGEKMDPDMLPPNLAMATRNDTYGKRRVSNYSHVYRRLNRALPAITMVPGHNAFPIHPTLNRTLTVREAARIQTFPDKHIFCGSRMEQCIQVGNAVPPRMAEPFIAQIKNYIEANGRKNQ